MLGWDADLRVSDSPGNAWYPAFTFGPDSVLYVWADNRNGGYEIYGSFGSYDFPVSGRTGYYPDVAYAHGRYAVVWQDGSGDIYVRYLDTVWSVPHPVFPTGNPQKEPAIFPFRDGFVVVWREDVSAYDSDVVGAVLRADLSLRDTFRIVQDGPQERAAVFVDSTGYVHVAYVDRSYGSTHPRIFYLRSLNPLGVKETVREVERRRRNLIDGRRIILGGGYDPSGRKVGR
jgi:hypothetical protein